MRKLLQVPIAICYGVSTAAFVVVGFMMLFLAYLYKWKGETGDPTYGTCYSGVLRHWLNDPEERLLAVRKSRYAYGPHFLVLYGQNYEEMLEFKSPRPRRDWRAWKHILFGFYGSLKKRKLRRS